MLAPASAASAPASYTSASAASAAASASAASAVASASYASAASAASCCSCFSLWVDVGSWGHAAPHSLLFFAEPSRLYCISVLHIFVAYLYWLIGQLKGGRD